MCIYCDDTHGHGCIKYCTLPNAYIISASFNEVYEVIMCYFQYNTLWWVGDVTEMVSSARATIPCHLETNPPHLLQQRLSAVCWQWQICWSKSHSLSILNDVSHNPLTHHSSHLHRHDFTPKVKWIIESSRDLSLNKVMVSSVYRWNQQCQMILWTCWTMKVFWFMFKIVFLWFHFCLI